MLHANKIIQPYAHPQGISDERKQVFRQLSGGSVDLPQKHPKFFLVKITVHGERSGISALPTSLSGEFLIEQNQELGHIESDVVEIEIVVAVLLHLQEVVQLEI